MPAHTDHLSDPSLKFSQRCSTAEFVASRPKISSRPLAQTATAMPGFTFAPKCSHGFQLSLLPGDVCHSRMTSPVIASTPKNSNAPNTFRPTAKPGAMLPPRFSHRSEEHTSELQSPVHHVCRLLLEKKKKKQN